MPAARTRALIVVSCTEGHRGQGQKGEYIIYNVEATTDDGTPVTEKLRCFDDLTPVIGQVGEYEVKPYVRQDETTYTLRPVNKPRLEPRIKELEDRVAVLEELIAELTGKPISGLEAEDPSTALPPAEEEVTF